MAFMLVRSKVRDCFVMRMTRTRLSFFLKHRTSIERRRLQRPQTSVSGCKNLAWSTSQTSTSLIGNRWVRPSRLPMRPRGGILERSPPA